MARKFGRLDTGDVDAKSLYAAIYREYWRKQSQERARIVAVQRSSQHGLDMQQLGSIYSSLQHQFKGVDWGFTDLDTEAAMDKLKQAAMQNDASVVRADCFEPARLSMPAFKQALRQVLSMQLSKREFAALVKYVRTKASDVLCNRAHLITLYWASQAI